MEVLLFYFAVLIIISGVVLFYVAYKSSKGLFEEEKGEIPIHHEQAGGRFDLFNWSIPFVRVAVYSTFIAISCWNFKIVLKKGDVTDIEERGLFFQGLQILHNRKDIPKKIVIWTTNSVHMKALIARHFL